MNLERTNPAHDHADNHQNTGGAETWGFIYVPNWAMYPVQNTKEAKCE